METILNLFEAQGVNNDINKKLFVLKPAKSNGLVLNIHHTSTKKHVRIIHCDFHPTGNLLALASNEGKIFLIDFLLGRHWSLPKFDSCCCMKFSRFSDTEILVAKNYGSIEIVNINNSARVATLLCHKYAVTCISFADDYKCVSASKHEAVIWDMANYCRLQVLLLEDTSILKFVHFVPVSNHILACFQDDIIQIWQRGTFITLKQFLPSNWSNHSVRSVTFSQNGRIMVVSGYIPILAIFLLDNWSLLKKIKLPNYIKTVKEIKLISENFDGGCNKVLTILSGKGVIYFYDLEKNQILSDLKSSCEISNFAISPNRCHYLACVLSSGDSEVYESTMYTLTKCPTEVVAVPRAPDKKLKIKASSRTVVNNVKHEIDITLNTDRLKSIVRQYEEFPDMYRAIIWERILKLPNNVQVYNNIVNHVTIVAFEDLYCKFPLEDVGLIKCLRNLLNNIVTWCPFFANVEFLPFFLFPFAKIFHKRPVACFELCCTIIVNWCQHWFQYYPLPPVNVLAMTENLLMEHDPDLLQHLSLMNVPAKIYSWTLLESAFSEVLTSQEWLKFWDHVIVNEPAFLICATSAYNIMQRKTILTLKPGDAEEFFRSQRPIDIKKLISKTYYILNNTSEKNHPRQYLEPFQSLDVGSYPSYINYPQTVIDFQREHMSYLDQELKELKTANSEFLLRQKMKQAKQRELEVEAEENRRLREVEKACLENIKSFQEKLKNEQEKLLRMKQDLITEEREIIDNTRTKLNKWKEQQKIAKTEILNDGMKVGNLINDHEFLKARDQYLGQQMQLLETKRPTSHELIEAPDKLNPEIAREVQNFQKETVKFKEMLNNANLDNSLHIRNVELAKQISMISKLIKSIEGELYKVHKTNNSGAKIKELENETEILNQEISKIVKVLAEKRKVNSSDSSESDQKSATKQRKTVKFRRNYDVR